MDILAKRIRQLRTDAGEKQIDLSSALHCSQGMISAYENGREPPYDILVAIARHYGTSCDYLLGMPNQNAPGSHDLLDALDAYAVVADLSGVQPVGADMLTGLFRDAADYLSGPMRAGTLPASAISSIISALRSLIRAVGASSTAEVINANNTLLQSILSVSDITTSYLNHRDG